MVEKRDQDAVPDSEAAANRRLSLSSTISSSHLSMQSTSTGANGNNLTLFTPSSTSYPYVDSDATSEYDGHIAKVATPSSEVPGPDIIDLPPSYEQALEFAPRPDSETQSLPPYIRSADLSNLQLDQLSLFDEAPVANGLSPRSPTIPSGVEASLLEQALEFTQNQPREEDIRYSPQLSGRIVIPQSEWRHVIRSGAAGSDHDRSSLRPHSSYSSSSRGCPTRPQIFGYNRDDFRRRGPPWAARYCHHGKESQASLPEQHPRGPVQRTIPQFARAFSKSLHPHSVTSAEFAAFIDGLNALLLAELDGNVYESLPRSKSEVEGQGLATSFLQRANQAFFAPRGLAVRVCRSEALYDVLEMPADESRRSHVTAGMLYTLDEIQKDKSALETPYIYAKVIMEFLVAWAEPLMFDLPEPAPQLKQLEMACLRVRRLDEDSAAGDAGTADANDFSLGDRKGSIASLKTVSTRSTLSAPSTPRTPSSAHVDFSTNHLTAQLEAEAVSDAFSNEVSSYEERYLATVREIEDVFLRQAAKGKTSPCALKLSREHALMKAAKELECAKAKIERREVAKAARRASAQEMRNSAEAWMRLVRGGSGNGPAKEAREAWRAEKRAMIQGWKAANVRVAGVGRFGQRGDGKFEKGPDRRGWVSAVEQGDGSEANVQVDRHLGGSFSNFPVGTSTGGKSPWRAEGILWIVVESLSG